MAAARLRVRGLCTTASRRISRASSSMDRPLPAARTRNRVFTSSSRLRMVMLANGVPHRTAEALIYAATAMQSSATSSALDPDVCAANGSASAAPASCTFSI